MPAREDDGSTSGRLGPTAGEKRRGGTHSLDPCDGLSGGWCAFVSQTPKAAKGKWKNGAFGVTVGVWPVASWNRVTVCALEAGRGCG